MTPRARGAGTFGGWGAPPRSRGGALRRRAGASAIVVAVCACIATAIAYLVLGGGGRHTGVARGAPPGPASAQTTIDSISAIVATSAADRRRVIAAIDAVQSCSLSASDGASTLESVVNDRRMGVSELVRLAAVRPKGINSLMIGDLMTTLNAAISDDESYMSWMGDIAGGHATCGADPMSDPNFAAAKTQSDRTDADKQAFVEEWNPLAQRYQKPTYQSRDF